VGAGVCVTYSQHSHAYLGGFADRLLVHGQVIEGVRVVDPFDETDPMLRRLLGNRIAEGSAGYAEPPNT